MVALNTAYAAPKNAADPKNRVGDFFYADRASVGQNRWANRLNTQEKSSYNYETASGRSNWPSRDPIGEVGGPRWFVLSNIIRSLQESGIPSSVILEMRSYILSPSEVASEPNLYGFNFNDPIRFYDFLGLSSKCCGGKPLSKGKLCCADKTEYTSRKERCCSTGDVVQGGRGSPQRCKCYENGGRWTTYGECHFGSVSECLKKAVANKAKRAKNEFNEVLDGLGSNQGGQSGTGPGPIESVGNILGSGVQGLGMLADGLLDTAKCGSGACCKK